MATKKVLITGMSGLIGGALRAHLEARGGYELTALNRRAVPGVRCHQADIRDLDAIAPAFEGQDVVVHLAAVVSSGGPVSLDDMLEFNLRGSHNVFEAARRAGCQRVVFASSGATVAGYELDEPYKSLAAGNPPAGGWPMLTHESPIRPRGLYGSSKAWGEALARSITDSSELSILCVRIGRVNEADKAEDPRTRTVWLSHRDCCTLLEAGINAPPTVKFDIVFGVSNNRYGYRDISHTEQVLGWKPQDSSDAFFKD